MLGSLDEVIAVETSALGAVVAVGVQSPVEEQLNPFWHIAQQRLEQSTTQPTAGSSIEI